MGSMSRQIINERFLFKRWISGKYCDVKWSLEKMEKAEKIEKNLTKTMQFQLLE